MAEPPNGVFEAPTHSSVASFSGIGALPSDSGVDAPLENRATVFDRGGDLADLIASLESTGHGVIMTKGIRYLLPVPGWSARNCGALFAE